MPPLVKQLPLSDYEMIWRQMREWCDRAAADAPDEIWVVEHPPVYTLGQAGRAEHLLRDNGIALVQTDRGGQITYHGPGQVVAYLMLDLRRRDLGARALTRKMESAVMQLLSEYGIAGTTDESAPGVYVEGAKIAALGLRIRRGRSYHGISFNADMDLSPFADINICGYSGLSATHLAAHASCSVEQVRLDLARCLLSVLQS